MGSWRVDLLIPEGRHDLKGRTDGKVAYQVPCEQGYLANRVICGAADE